MNDRQLLLGDDAVALGALHAGIAGAFSYPGTPATEIFEFIESHAAEYGVAARWSANEKVAYEAALGMSFVGRRAIVSMKHVGLNVAADPFMSSCLTGANGGLVLAVGDDPGMHSSQNEQDTRAYAQFGQIPLLEPATPQEAYDMTRAAFELSESHSTPVVIRVVTRLAHARAAVLAQPRAQHAPRPAHGQPNEWILLPPNARARFQRLIDLQPKFTQLSERSPFNRLELRGKRGVIASGVAWNYFCEAAGDAHDYSVLKLGMYPLPRALVRGLCERCDQILLLEEGFPLIERQLVGLQVTPGKAFHGRLDGTLPAQGELNVDVVRRALQLPGSAGSAQPEIPDRPPRLCTGCPHCDSYNAVVDAVTALGDREKHYYFSDIGCYTLAALPPYNAIDSCVEMGASIGMAIGAARAGAHPIVATIGDSTFIHSGMPALIEAAHDDLNMTVVILDNALVAMTGGQEAFATGSELKQIAIALGVPAEHVLHLEPLAKTHAQNVELVRREIEHHGLSVIIASRPCIHAKRRAAGAAKPARVAAVPVGK